MKRDQTYRALLSTEVVRWVCAAALVLGAAAFQAGTALSATISVNTTVDEPLSDPDNGNCSLREAIWSAIVDSSADGCLAGSGADTVFIPAGTYILTGEIVLSSDLTLDGEPGTYISGGDTTNILRRLSGNLTIQDLTLQNGVSVGGGCFEQGNLYVTVFSNVTLKNCTASGRGGAIASYGGDLIIQDSLLQNNTASGDPSGNNSGGAIYTTGNLTITRTFFNLNSVDLSASPGQGGAIHLNGGTYVIEDSTFEGNQAVVGGAIFGSAGDISGSTFFNNSASGDAGAVNGSSLTVTDSTFSSNDKGALRSSGTTTITNSTFYDNTGAASIARQVGTITIKNTMLFSFFGGVNCSNTITSAGYNFDNNYTCALGGTGDLGGTDPLLGALDWNGGYTRTHALSTGSSAIDAGTNTDCPVTDQRGLSRPQDGDDNSTDVCDIGAYERIGITFSDVGRGHWAFGFVEALAEAGLTAGYPDGTYRPANQVTRAEMAVFLLKGIHGASYTPPTPDGSHPFSDIGSHWAEAWIEQLYDEGLTAGYPDNTYRPFNNITRSEMAVMLLRAKHGGGYTPPTPNGSHPFSDIGGHWANAWIEQLYDEGITAGYPDGTFRPFNNVTRAEMAVFLVNTFSLTVY